jgi:hypothetical protein
LLFELPFCLADFCCVTRAMAGSKNYRRKTQTTPEGEDRGQNHTCGVGISRKTADEVKLEPSEGEADGRCRRSA